MWEVASQNSYLLWRGHISACFHVNKILFCNTFKKLKLKEYNAVVLNYVVVFSELAIGAVIETPDYV